MTPPQRTPPAFLPPSTLHHRTTPHHPPIRRISRLPLPSPAPSPRTTRAPRASSASPQPLAPFAPLAPPFSPDWELDFYSRPALGPDGKKLWELLVIDRSGAFEHVEAVPNAAVNSRELRARVLALIESAPIKPQTIRYFRSKMSNMINIALSDIPGVVLIPSRKTNLLYRALEDREKNVYPTLPGYNPASKIDPLAVELDMTNPMPDVLRGEKYAFASLTAQQVAEMPREELLFGDIDYYDEDLAEAQAAGTIIPGLVMWSKRAQPIAAWMNGIELVYLRVLMEKKELALACGLDKLFLVAKLSDQTKAEAKKFEQEKTKARGLHFIAVQESPDSEEIQGFWLLKDFAPPS